MHSRIQTKIAGKDWSPNVHGWHQTVWEKWKKKMETLKHAVRIYSQDIGMEFGIEKCAMKVMKSGKWHLTDGLELPNQDQVRMPRVKETYKYLGISEADTIMRWKKKSRKNISGKPESQSRQNHVAETLSKE